MTDPVGAVSQTLYNAVREVSGIIGPDPDGAGPKRNRAVDIQRNADGTENYRQAGTVNPDASGFTGLQLAYTTYDAYGRKVTERINPVTNGAATAAYSLTQYSYDAVGRLECTAVRMTPSTYGSLPASACTQTSAGTDRISKTIYEWAGLPYQVQTGVGTSLARNEVSYLHNLNGQTTSVTDAKGNVTAYSYDGHLRLSRTCYNTSVATCTTGTPTDFVSVSYGITGTGTGKMVSRKLRGNGSQASIAFAYDALGRTTGIDYPGPGMFDSDVGFTYDLLGRMTKAEDGNTHKATFGFDGLGRVTSQGDSLSARTMTYDAAGRRTSLSWPGGPTINYEYDATGAMTAIKEGTSTSLATFGYDDMGRRTSLTRGNGVVTSYGYDGGSRLTSMGLNLAGTARDLNLGFSYNAAGQITQRTADNDAYAWTQHYNVNRGYTANALNQYSGVGSLSPTYDAKGNLTQAGSSTYSYDTKNELVITSDTGKQFYYDPLGRMDAVLPASGTALAGFQYDGDHIADEFNPAASNAITRRYVWGPGADEPLMWYEGSGTTDKRYLVADERGSVVAVTDAAGNATAINAYDEYGIPASTNMGRFQYTGQAWIPELGMYSYKARIYSPTLGRFMQTDPIGYDDGPNWYNYVGGDPVNGSDPSGLQAKQCEAPTGSHIVRCVEGGNNAGSAGASSGSSNSNGGGSWHVLEYTMFDGGKWRGDPFFVTDTTSMSYSMSGGANGGLGGTPQNGDAQDGGDIEVMCDAACQARKRGIILVKENQTPIPGSGGGGADSGCIRMFNVCRARADSFPDDFDARREYLDCRESLKVCAGIEQRGNTGFVQHNGVGFVVIVNGESYFIPFSRH